MCAKSEQILSGRLLSSRLQRSSISSSYCKSHRHCGRGTKRWSRTHPLEMNKHREDHSDELHVPHANSNASSVCLHKWKCTVSLIHQNIPTIFLFYRCAAAVRMQLTGGVLYFFLSHGFCFLSFCFLSFFFFSRCARGGSMQPPFEWKWLHIYVKRNGKQHQRRQMKTATMARHGNKRLYRCSTSMCAHLIRCVLCG